MESLNVSLFLAVNGFAGIYPLLDVVAIAVAEALPFVYIVIVVAMWFRGSFAVQHSVVNATFAAILAQLINFSISLFYFHPRPFMEGLGTTLFEKSGNNSFPSDHTTFVLSIAIMFCLTPKTQKVGLLLLGFGLLCGLTRIFCGVHFPFDILGAIVVAFISAVGVLTMQGRTYALAKYCSEKMLRYRAEV